MKKFVVLAIALALSGCSEGQYSTDQAAITDSTHEFDVICLDGVQYWYTDGNLAGTAAVMAPRYKVVNIGHQPVLLECQTASEKM